MADRGLTLANVTVRRGADFEVSVPELNVAGGEAVAIVGRSGAGKSTVLDMLAGVLRPVSAERFEMRFAGDVTDVAALWQRGDQAGLRALRARALGYVLQTGGLAPFLTIAENVALPFWRDGVRPGAEVATLLEALGIDALASRRPRDVSVGQRQRAAIARALATGPELILADEPTAALDADTAEAAMGLLARLTRERGIALVVVTHDAELAERHGLRLLTCARAGPGRARLDALPAGEA